MVASPKRISIADEKEIELKLLKGVVLRTSTLLFIWTFIGIVYGIVSIDVFHTFLPKLTIWQNVWPRILLSGFPSLLLAFWYKNYQSNVRLKAYLTIVILPFLLAVASGIYAWPAFFSGNYDAYLYFHATNIIAMSSALAIVSAPPAMVIGQAISFLIIYFGPLLFLFSKNRPLFPELIISDVLMMSLILYVGLRTIYKLRLTLATEDLMRKQKTAAFLGGNLTKALYETKEMKFQEHTALGLVLAVDLRGYTKFIQTNNQDTVRTLMSDFHQSVAKIIYQNSGYLHKTNGDGLLISFGVMNNNQDLSDVPGIESDEDAVRKNRLKNHLESAVKSFGQIGSQFEQIRNSHKIQQELVLGAGLSVGNIDVLIRGEESTRQELDIDGMAIIKAVRLEAYSKALNQKLDMDSSFLVIDPEFAESFPENLKLPIWSLNKVGDKIRDFPEIEYIYYRRWKHNRTRDQKNSAA